jgi:hypothetical protein
MTLRLTRVDGKTAVALQSAPGEGGCSVTPSLFECMNELVREPVPPPDVCGDAVECRADVLLAFD